MENMKSNNTNIQQRCFVYKKCLGVIRNQEDKKYQVIRKQNWGWQNKYTRGLSSPFCGYRPPALPTPLED